MNEHSISINFKGLENQSWYKHASRKLFKKAYKNTCDHNARCSSHCMIFEIGNLPVDINIEDVIRIQNRVLTKLFLDGYLPEDGWNYTDLINIVCEHIHRACTGETLSEKDDLSPISLFKKLTYEKKDNMDLFNSIYKKKQEHS